MMGFEESGVEGVWEFRVYIGIARFEIKEGPLEGTLNLIPLYNPPLFIEIDMYLV